MVLSRGCTCLRSALPLARARSSPTQQNLYSPTEFRTHSCWDILPQISQNTQNFLAEIFSHRFHRFTQNFLAGKNSVKSVDSVGDIHALTSVRICEICGSFFNYKLRVKSVGVFSTTNLEWILWGFSTTNFRKASVTAIWAQRYSGAVTI